MDTPMPMPEPDLLVPAPTEAPTKANTTLAQGTANLKCNIFNTIKMERAYI